MDKLGVYTNGKGQLCEVFFAPEYVESLVKDGASVEEAHATIMNMSVPEGISFKIVESVKVPASLNYRDAWFMNGDTVYVDLEKAKECQKALMIMAAWERVEQDTMGVRDFSVVQAEIEAIDFDSITDFDTLYNTFPASIDRRSGARVYEMHKKE